MSEWTNTKYTPAQLVAEIIADCERDAMALADTPFTAQGTSKVLGEMLATMLALAEVVRHLIPEPEPEPAKVPKAFVSNHNRLLDAIYLSDEKIADMFNRATNLTDPFGKTIVAINEMRDALVAQRDRADAYKKRIIELQERT